MERVAMIVSSHYASQAKNLAVLLIYLSIIFSRTTANAELRQFDAVI
jgi:hypothetical protein